MRNRHNGHPQSPEKNVRDIRRATHRRVVSEEKIRIVLEGLRGEDSIAELAARKASTRTSIIAGRRSSLRRGRSSWPVWGCERTSPSAQPLRL